jgi:uncharacterized CHY-type Zn-finger protein
MRDDFDTEDCEVGYQKPPKRSQFKKGVSGNPTGRPKKAPDFEPTVLRELNSPLTINENGKRRVITKDAGIVKQLVNKALGGHVPSMRQVDDWRRQAREWEAEQQRLANRTVKELSDAELKAMIRAGEKQRLASGGCPPVFGIGIDPDGYTRCAHYRTSQHVTIAIKMKCCGVYYACKECHEALAGHPIEVWPEAEWTQPAVVCGACAYEMTIREYMELKNMGPFERCPRCPASFDNGRHYDHKFYFANPG